MLSIKKESFTWIVELNVKKSNLWGSSLQYIPDKKYFQHTEYNPSQINITGL